MTKSCFFSAPRHLLVGFSALVAASALACLTAPDEPGGDASPLGCATNQRTFNGECRTVCTRTSDCTGGQICSNVGGGQTLCVPYAHCTYLGTDTSCAAVNGGSGSYETYGYRRCRTFTADCAPGYEPGDTDGDGCVDRCVPASYPYSYASNGCLGNATWEVEPASGDPACGQDHAIVRCTATPSGCRLAATTTSDVAEP
jgi:hypothetical protein